MALDLRDSIYTEIANQFPSIYREDGSFLVSFVESYYQHLDEKMDRNVPKLRDIDSTLSSFLVFFKKKYLADLPLDAAVDVRFVLKHIKDMYTRKGTQESLELLFKIFFDQDIEVFYPSTAILRPSDSIWGGDAYLEMHTVFQVDDYPIVKGDRIRGDLSQATAFVDEVIFINFSGSLSPIIYLSNITGSFSSDDGLIVSSLSSVTNVGKLISGSVSVINVSDLNRVANQAVGDKISIVSRLNGTDATARVLTTSQQETGSIDFRVLDEGFGYIDPSSSISVSNNIGISNQVLIVDSASTVSIKPGDVISASASPLTYSGSDVAGAAPYVISGQVKVIAYNHPLLFVQSSTIEDYNGLFSAQPNNSTTTSMIAQAFATFSNNTLSNAITALSNISFAPYQTWGALLGAPFPDSGDTNPAGDFTNDGSINANDVSVFGNTSSIMNTDLNNDAELLYQFSQNQVGIKYDSFGGLTPEATSTYKTQYSRFWRALTLLGFYHPFTAVTTQPTPSGDNLSGSLATGVAFPVVQSPQFSVSLNNGATNVNIISVGTINDTAKFTVGRVSNKETVTLITDRIGDFTNQVLDADSNPNNDDYQMSGPGAENLNTTLGDAFTPITITIGSVDTLSVSSAGSNYQSDVFANLELDIISKFEKKDFILNFGVIDFNIVVGDIITQERTIPDIEVSLTGNLSEAELEALPATSSNGAVGYQDSITTFDYVAGSDIAYTSKAKFLRRDGSDFYFRPMSFYSFDEARDGSDVLVNKVSIGGLLKSFTGLRTDPTSLSMGNNARIQGIASYQTGQIDELSIVKTGYRYEDGETVDIFNIEPNSASYNKKVAEASIRTLGQGKTEGRWKSKTSFLSEESKRLHDNDYYQEYSYDVSSIVDPKKYIGLISDVVGVAGTKLFSTPLINSDNTIDTSLDVEFVYYNIEAQKLIATDGLVESDYITESSSTIHGNETFLAADIATQTGIS